MFSTTANLYYVIYSLKDYANEAEKLRKIIRRENPGAKTILDVACGTGEHARNLGPEFQVNGIDIESTFVEIARAKCPLGRFHVADMRSFELPERYDVVQCLFSSIGYLLHETEIITALAQFRKHLAPGGIVLVEPWLSPAEFDPGRPRMLTVDRPDLKICRMAVSARDGDVSILHFHYLIGDTAGVRHADEVHRMLLISPERLTQLIQVAGLGCNFDPVGLMGRGLFVARAIDDATCQKREPV
jgi:SAM-dependent methyltransferase